MSGHRWVFLASDEANMHGMSGLITYEMHPSWHLEALSVRESNSFNRTLLNSELTPEITSGQPTQSVGGLRFKSQGTATLSFLL